MKALSNLIDRLAFLHHILSVPRFLLSQALFLLIFMGLGTIGFVTPAHAAPPDILSPDQTSYAVTEGNILVLPFTVQEPDNDVVDYSVEYLVGAAAQPLQAWATFRTDPKTAQRDPAPDPGTEAFCRADCNADGSLSLADVTCIIHKLLGR